MDKEIEKLLDSAETFVATTIDGRGFPHPIALSRPLERNGFHYLKFYINGEGRTANNIRENRMGSLFCFDLDTHESLALKGYFLLEELEEYQKLAGQLNAYQKELNHQEPVIAQFQTLTVKHYKNLKTEFIEPN
ncbi:hypothetical protein NRIC_29070 [Enterococcus florum]|uniref:Uncharacterized protein n=1 Tax=Enterococcus florum TaxID=2480627 RepID=A0A4P5PBC7_9ENTE|nr:pyridoxamine 5'-phosphate oxidase family protein [Enterococcus florum]GCF95016.1 hypothetical protein NRIC_29070 [Enterococcus florum]